MRVRGVYYAIILSAILAMAVAAAISYLMQKMIIFTLLTVMLTNLIILMLMILVAMSVDEKMRERVIWAVNLIFIVLLIVSITLFMSRIIVNIKPA